MSPISKFEATGIFVSVAIMAVALGLMRFQYGTTNQVAEVTGDSQAALVAVSDEQTSLADALMDAATADGQLKKLVIDDVRLGDGDPVEKGDTVTVHYIGSTQSGVQFDSSYVRGEPFSFTVGDGKVIQGWEEGLIGMRAGGQRVLVIPSDMAYGNRQVGPIAAGSTLVFAIELIEVKK
jgi:peptidylprolyl isomerase